MAPVERAASPDGRRADAALATAPTPADSAAPPAAARLPTLAVAAAPMAAPALENLVKFNKNILLSNHDGDKKKKATHAKVAAGLRKNTKSRQAIVTATAKPARPPSEDRATWTAPVSQLAAGSGNLTPVAF